MKNALFSLLALLFLTSCQKETFLPEEEIIPFNNSFPGVDERLWTYFSAFEEEAAFRNINIDLVFLRTRGVIEEIPEEHIAGSCNYSSNRPGQVTIDLNFWNTSNARSREFVVFHELGHCVLLRDHEEGTNANGTCQSIMRSGNGDCRDNYRSTTRDFYLDELYSRSGEL